MAVVATLTSLPQGQDAAADIKSQRIQNHCNNKEDQEEWQKKRKQGRIVFDLVF